MVTIVEETIGPDLGDDYSTVRDWKNAHDGEDFTLTDNRYIGLLKENGTADNNENFYFDAAGAGTVSDATRYRQLRAAPGHHYAPAAGSGAEITLSGVQNVIFRLGEPHFRLGPGIGLIHTRNGTGIQRCVRADRECWINGIYAKMTAGNNVANAVIQQTVGHTSGIVYVTNCIVRGSAHTGLLAQGPRYGFRLTQGAGTVRIYNCVAFEISQQENVGLGEVHGYGYAFDGDVHVRNCIGASSLVFDFDESATAAAFDHCCSSDATATGTGSLTNKSQSDVFERAPNDGYALKVGTSPAIDTGVDLSADWPDLPVADYEDLLHSRNGQGWDMGALNYDGSRPEMLLGSVC